MATTNKQYLFAVSDIKDGKFITSHKLVWLDGSQMMFLGVLENIFGGVSDTDLTGTGSGNDDWTVHLFQGKGVLKGQLVHRRHVIHYRLPRSWIEFRARSKVMDEADSDMCSTTTSSYCDILYY